MIRKGYKMGRHTIPVVAELGTGDIQITNHSDSEMVGISFTNGGKKEIGVFEEYKNGETSDDLKEIPMMITFTNPRSIDSLISQLELAKQKLIEIKN